MPRLAVTLHLEQRATVEVDAPEEAGDDELTALALARLDESGGLEWQTECAWVDSVTALP